MLRFLPVLLLLALTLFALIDCLSRDEDEIRALPKVLWVLIILLFAPIGPVAWFIAGRPRGAALPGAGRVGRGDAPGGPSAPRRQVAPDDDPEFLRGLDERRRRDHTDDEEHDR
jgi:Phospholipase_D-nuclease N-terminal